jgi:hypothetical protein
MRAAARRRAAKPCSTPKLIQLFGNISAEPADTSSAHAAICDQRFQKRGQAWPASSATACESPATAMNSVTITARCTVQKGSL